MADKKVEDLKTGQENAENTSPPASSEKKIVADDPELDDLLDSALEDFDKPPPSSSTTTEAAPPPAAGLDTTQVEADFDLFFRASMVNMKMGMQDPMALFEQVFAAEADGGDMQQQMAEAMRAMMGDDPGMMQHLDQLAKAASAADESEESQKAFTDTLQSTLDSLSQNAQNMEGGMSEEDIMRAMGNLNMEDGFEGGELDFMPMMQGMLKSLLSKDVLYPSLKEISTKYPDWLSENKSTLQAEEYTNYEQQYNFMRQICEEFEAEQESDSDLVKAQRFQKIMDMMQQMQNFGQPPKEIVGDMMPGIEFDDQGNPQVPNLGQQCSVM